VELSRRYEEDAGWSLGRCPWQWGQTGKGGPSAQSFNGSSVVWGLLAVPIAIEERWEDMHKLVSAHYRTLRKSAKGSAYKLIFESLCVDVERLQGRSCTWCRRSSTMPGQPGAEVDMVEPVTSVFRS
jgi:hypothetical protein